MVSFSAAKIIKNYVLNKFYEKKIAGGILYLITLGIFGVGVIVDLIKILLRKDRFYTIN